MKQLFFAAVSLIFLCLAGCSPAVHLEKTGAGGREDYETSFISNGALSAETTNLLSNNLLKNKITTFPNSVIHELELLCKEDFSSKTIIAVAETAQMIASRLQEEPEKAISYHLTTLIYTQNFFQYAISHHSALLFDPEVIIAVKCYNSALTELFSYLCERNLHTAGAFELTAAGGQTISFSLPKFNLPVAPEKIESFNLCADFRTRGLTHNSRRFGIGVPLICDLTDNAVPETTFAEGQVIPATLCIRMTVPENENNPERRNARLFYLDSRSLNEVTVNQITIPLAQDFSTPLAYMVKDPPPFDFLQRTFQIELTQQYEGLYHLEPHSDDRIPIVLVHGLMSDIRTWLQLINTLQSDPELRKNYRFMGFSYSSGNPIFVSAMQLRQALAQERTKLQNDGRDLTKFDQMILIGHSMGGLISRLMISTSNDELLAGFIGKENYYNAIDYQDPEFRELMIFSPVPSVRRMVFIAVPHRGSDLARRWFAQMASSMIKIPQSLIDFNKKLLSSLLILSEEEKISMLEKFNGISNLSPDGTALQLLNLMPIDNQIPYHSIIGNQEGRGIPGGSDGVVPYSSSHLDHAVSEVVVQSGHSVQQNPLAIQEIKRILKQHLKELENE